MGAQIELWRVSCYRSSPTRCGQLRSRLKSAFISIKPSYEHDSLEFQWAWSKERFPFRLVPKVRRKCWPCSEWSEGKEADWKLVLLCHVHIDLLQILESFWLVGRNSTHIMSHCHPCTNPLYNKCGPDTLKKAYWWNMGQACLSMVSQQTVTRQDSYQSFLSESCKVEFYG